MQLSVLAEQLGWSRGHTSRIVGELDEWGCVRTTTARQYKTVVLSKLKPIEQYESLVLEYDHVDFPNLIAGSGLQLLYYLNRPRTATALTEASSLSRATVYRRLNTLQNVGIVGKSQSAYELNSPFTPLSEIARGLVHQRHRSEARQYATDVTILWETHNEYLFACDDDIDAEGFHATGPSQFAEFGIPLLTQSRRHHFRSEREVTITPAALICHTLLIDTSSRYRTYCLLLIEEESVERDVLRENASHYNAEADFDLLKLIDDILTYLETAGTNATEQLPAWEEFKQTAADYEISL